MITLQQARKIIDQHINTILDKKSPKELYEPIKYILSHGGKRIRPALTLLGCNLFTDEVAQAIPPAIALEIFHNFTLVHDDIMDNAKLRRGMETIHLKWGNNTAILSGDAMCIVAYDYLLKCNAEHFKPVFDIFNKAALEVCEGQQLDMNYENSSQVSVKDYLLMIELKTSVLLAACLKIGALTGNASLQNADLLYSFGRNTGLAFQLQDDLLDVFGDEKILGKEIGKDIVSNKKTYLLIKALEIGNDSQINELKNWINAKSFDPEEKIKSVRDIYNSLNIKSLTNSKIEHYFNNALCDLEKITVAHERKQELISFLHNLRIRKS